MTHTRWNSQGVAAKMMSSFAMPQRLPNSLRHGMAALVNYADGCSLAAADAAALTVGGEASAAPCASLTTAAAAAIG